ncbi:lipase [Legionella norrlandica]|uniref:Lipase n=1 Tax=Legionella norrlandica TaxID=1498499 RepID=A0A0A2SQA3_9GAMM|nr:alpha/beta hydrolase [Legionella norrlandica]KGP63320.1 lipase [Legionella norrlandica]
MNNVIINKNLTIQLILMLFFGIFFYTPSYAFLSKNRIEMHTTNSVVTMKPNHAHEIVVLIHGLMRTYMSMRPLKTHLESLGYEVYLYKYPSAKYTIQQHGIYLNQFISTLLVDHPGLKVHFITHSLGGIVVREALSKLSQKQLKNIGYLIMLAPPNQGSDLAKLSIKFFPMITYFIKPLGELSSDETSYVHRVPIPNIKMGIIAGRFDAKVPPSSAYLQGQAEPVIINTTHTFIMNNSKTKELIINFLEKGAFQ